MAASAGLEPATIALTGRCSAIGAKKPYGRQGWTRTNAFPCERVTAACSRRCATCRYVVGVERFELPTFRSQAGRSSQTELRSDKRWWTWWDLNPRSPACKAGAFPLSYKPIWCSRQDSNLYCTDSHSVFSTRIGILEHGAVNGSRTRDLRLGKPMFCQLNYYCMVHDAGLEPAPFCL